MRSDFQRALQEDRQRRVQAAGLNIEVFLVSVRVKKAWDHLARWYCNVQGKQAHPTREGLDQESAVRA